MKRAELGEDAGRVGGHSIEYLNLYLECQVWDVYKGTMGQNGAVIHLERFPATSPAPVFPFLI